MRPGLRPISSCSSRAAVSSDFVYFFVHRVAVLLYEEYSAVGVLGEHRDGRAVQDDFAQLFCARREFHRVDAHVDYMSLVWEFAF